MTVQAPTIKHQNEIVAVARGSGVAFIGKTTQYIIGLLYGVLVARAISTEQLGLYMLGVTMLQFLMPVCLLGLQRGVIRYVAVYLSQEDKARASSTVRVALAAVFVASLLMGGMLVLGADYLTNAVFHKPGLEMILRWFAFMLPFATLSAIVFSALQAVQDIKGNVLAEVFVSLALQFALTIILLQYGLGLYGLLLADAISRIIGLTVALWLFHRRYPLLPRLNRLSFQEGKSLLAFSFPLLFMTFFSLIMGQNDIIMLGIFDSSESVAIYSIALRASLSGSIFLFSFTTIFSPIVAGLIAKQNYDGLQSLYTTVTKWIFTCTFAWFLFAVLFSNDLLSIFGSKYLAGRTVFITLCVGQLINSGVGAVGVILIMAGRTRVALLNFVLMTIINIPLNIFLINRYGIEGAAITNTVTLALGSLYGIAAVFILFRIHPYDRGYLKPIVSGAVTSLLTALLYSINVYHTNPIINLALGGLFFLSIYFLIIYFLGINKEDRVILDRIIKRMHL